MSRRRPALEPPRAILGAVEAPPGEQLELRETTILDRRWWPASWAWRVFFFASVSGALLRSVPLAALAVGALAFLGWVSARRAPLAGTPRVRLIVDRDGIASGSIQLVDRGQITEGALWPSSAHGTFVQLVRGGLRPPVEIATKTLAEARALLRVLELDGARSVARFGVRSLLYSRVGYALGVLTMAAMLFTLAIGFATTGHGSPLRWALVSSLVAASIAVIGALLAVWPTTVTVGADGVLVRWALVARFVRFADVEEYQVFQRGVRLRVRGGRPIVLRTDGDPEGVARRDALVERLREAASAESVDASALARGGRPVEDWLRTLRGLRVRAEGFRDVPFDPVGLWSVLRDPHAAPTARLGAAVALTRDLDEEGRARLRVAAEAIVSPPLRVAMRAVVTDDEAALHEALAALADEERARR